VGEGSSGLFGVARKAALGAACVLLVYAALRASWLLVNQLLLVFLAVVVAIGLRAAARWLSARTGVSTRIALAITVLAVYGLPVAGAALLAPHAREQGEQLEAELPELRQKADDFLRRFDWKKKIGDEGAAPQKEEEEGSPTAAALSAIEGQGPSDKALSWVTGFVGTLGSAIGGLLFVAVVSVYLAGSPGLYENGVLKLFPLAVRAKARAVLDEIAEELRRWILGQIAASVIVGVATWGALAALGIPMSLLFGVLAGLLDFIPNFGPLIAALPAVLVASGEGKVPHVIAVFCVIQALEGWVLRPFIEKKAVDTPPAVLLCAQVLLGTLLGFMGLLMAPALIVVAKVVVDRLWIEEALGDDADAPA
jgi:predicted PurR-regulated permease PerM